MPLGILFGFLAAFFQSISYLCTKLYLRRHKNDIGTLLALSHIIMGVLSVPIVLYVKPDEMPSVESYRWTLLATAVFYLLGQTFLFVALIKTEASRISPLLGLKIVILALISVLFLQQSLGPAQWIAVACCSLAAFLLSNSGTRLHLSSVLWVVLACLAYSLCDLNIKALVDHFSHLGVMRGALLATGLTYMVCGIVGLVFVLFKRDRLNRKTWGYSLPFALSWLIAMVFLFSCFALIGVVFGNIVQSTRGLISIGFGVWIAHLGFERVEPKISRSVFIRRVAAALLMTGAVVLFYWGR